MGLGSAYLDRLYPHILPGASDAGDSEVLRLRIYGLADMSGRLSVGWFVLTYSSRQDFYRQLYPPVPVKCPPVHSGALEVRRGTSQRLYGATARQRPGLRAPNAWLRMETRKQGRRQLNGDKYIVARVSLRRRKRLRIADHWMGWCARFPP